MSLSDIHRLESGRTARCSSWDRTGRNHDAWILEPGETRVLADIKGPGKITHIWMTQRNHYRECLLRITWDNARYPSVLCPLGDFFCLGHSMVNSFQSLLFSASTARPYEFDQGCALNCYAPMPFRERAVVELVNESKEKHRQFFYIDYETAGEPEEDCGYFHAEFRRTNPFRGWAPDISINSQDSHVANKGRTAWKNNYCILETRGRGHYIGCNLSVTNFSRDLNDTWGGEGDDMIWVDGYKWPPDLHGTGSEDYLNQAWGMQENAFLRNGSSIFEGRTTIPPSTEHWLHGGGYQTGYVFHVENPVRFSKEIKVTIEHGHGNHLANDYSSVAYWYAARPTRTAKPPAVAKRMPVLRDNKGRWLIDKKNECPGPRMTLTPEMRRIRARRRAKGGS